MNDIVVVYMTGIACLLFALIAVGVFCIGFLLGYKNESKRIKNEVIEKTCNEISESEEEKRKKKEWKKFLEYDGSTIE